LFPDDTVAALQKLFSSSDEQQAREFAEVLAKMNKADDDIWK
jgi:hypothetical protein